jgi:hypothetical protein
VRLGQVALRALRQKHLLLYFEDQEATAVLRDLGWAGALAPSRGDYVMVVDFNVGFNKVNAVVEESLDYAVDLTDPTRPRAALTVHHRHPVDDWSGPCSQEPRYSSTYAGMTRRCYYDYLRVYVPSGAELLWATPHPVPGSILLSGQRQRGEVDVSRGEAGTTSFATLLVLRPGESMETTFAYALPEATVERVGAGWHYRLTVQKQPGRDANPLELTLRLPSGAEIADGHPAPTERHGSTLRYHLDLRTDVALDLTWQ